MASNYDANIRIAVTGQNQIDAAANSINRLQKLIDQVSRGVVLTGADPRRLSAGWDGVANSISRANRELQQFAQTANRLTRAPQRALPAARNALPASAQTVDVQARTVSASPAAQGIRGAISPDRFQGLSRRIENLSKDLDTRNIRRSLGDSAADSYASEPPRQLRRGAQQMAGRFAALDRAETEIPQNAQRIARALDRAADRLEPAAAGIGGGAGSGRGGGRRGGPPPPPPPLELPLGPPFPSGNRPGRQIASPLRGTEDMTGSPRAIAAGNLRRLNTIGSAAIGGGFPLLFGQGAGAGLGGALGGLAGGALGGSGGFAGGIVGSLIGTQFDKLKASAIGLADALKAPSEALAAMEASGIKVSSGLKNTVDALEGMGRASEAQALVFAELEKLGGTDYVQNLLELEEANKALQDQWSLLSVAVQKELLPWFIEFTNAAVVLAGVLKEAAPLLKAIGPALEAAFTAANPFGALSLLKNGASVIAGPGGVKKDDNKIRQPGPVGDTRQRKALDEAIARQKEAEDLRRRGIQLELSQIDFRTDQEEAIFNLRKRAADLDREAAEFRRDIEDKIFAKQQENARTLADLTRQRAQNAIERQDQSLEPLGRIAPEEGGGRAAGVDLVREYIRARAEGEADLQQKEIETQLKMQEIRRDNEKFALDVAKKIREFSDKAEQFARDVTKYEFDTAKKVYSLQIEAADYQYAMWENAYKRATEIGQILREASLNPLGDMTGGGEGPVIGGTAGLRQGIERIKGAYSFRGTTLAQNKRPGDYQSDPRENFFFDFQSRPIIEAAKRRVGTLTSGEIAALTLTVLTEAGPTNVGKFDVAANLISRSAMAGNQPISRIAAAPGQYEGVFSRGLTPRQLEDPAVGRRLFGSAFDTWFQRFGGFGKGAEATTGSAPNALGTPIGATVGGAPAGPARPAAPIPLPARRAGGVGPAFLPQLPGGVNLGGLDRRYKELNEEQIRLVERLQQEARVRNELADITARTKLDEGTAAIGQQFLQPVLDARQAAEDKFATEKQYSDLLQDGVLPALAEQLSQAQELEKTQLRQLDIQIKIADIAAEQARKDVAALELVKGKTAEQEKQLQDAQLAAKLFEGQGNGLRDTRAGIVGAGDQLQAQLIQNESPEARRQKALNQYSTRKNERDSETRPFEKYMEAKADLEDLVDPLNQVISATNALGSAFGDAFQGIISGSETADEALKKMFANIGSYFLNMAAQILAQQAMTSILGLISGGAGAAGGGIGAFGNSNILSSGIGAAFGGARAEGGPVSSGSAYLVGENGPELFLPSGNGSIVPNSQGAPAQLKPADQYGMGGQELPEVTYSGAVLRFNEQDYVAKGDVPKIIKMSVAATGREMRNSVSYRNRAGI